MKEKIPKVAMVVATAFPANHGTPGSIIKMSKQIIEKGFDVHVVTYHVREFDLNLPFAVHRIPDLYSSGVKMGVGPSLRRIWFDLLMVYKLLSVVLKEKIDIIHTHNYEGQLIGFVVSFITRLPIVYHAHNNMIDELPQYENIKPKFLAVWFSRMLDFFVPRTADHIIAISKNIEAFLIEKRIKPETITRVPLEFSMDCFEHKTARQINAQYSLPPGPRIIYTGTLDKFQRIDYLLKAFANVSAAVPEACLIVVANQYKSHQLAEFNDICEGYGIGRSISLVAKSALADLLSLISACDVAVISRPECPGFPMKILNYMASGTAIVCFEKSGACLVHEETALLARDHDTRQFSDHIIRLLKDAQLNSQLGKNAKKSFDEMKSNSKTSKITKIYKILLHA